MNPVLEEIKKISQKHKSIAKVILFGSRARGDHTSRSDYDIAIFSHSIDQSEKNLILDEIEHIDTLHRIDIIFIDQNTSPALMQNINKDGVIIMDKFQVKFDNYKKALSRLHETIEEYKENDSLSIRDGAIQRFEFTSELAWKTIREYLLTLEITDINNPRDVMKQAYSNNIIANEAKWIQILRDRNSTSHIYDEYQADEIYDRIAKDHIQLFDLLLNELNNR